MYQTGTRNATGILPVRLPSEFFMRFAHGLRGGGGTYNK